MHGRIRVRLVKANNFFELALSRRMLYAEMLSAKEKRDRNEGPNAVWHAYGYHG